jgi:hypothetical protein
MAEPRFSNVVAGDIDDDLPRTLRREREAQARRAREQDESRRAREQDESRGSRENELTQKAVLTPDIAPPPFEPDHYDYDDLEPAPATVTKLDIPFLHLMMFFLKAVIAGIPALILLLAILWGIGEVLTATFPELIKMKILIGIAN